MRFCIRLAVAAGLGLAASAALAQDNAVVLLDARHKTVFCVVPDYHEIVAAAAAGDTTVLDIRKITQAQPCAQLAKHDGFLVQGQRNQLEVVNRKFLTRYSFFVDNVTPVGNFAIEDLNEAANLTTPFSSSGAAGVSKGAAPKGLAASGALTLRNAQDLITELLNPATASNAANDIASDWIAVKREAESVHNDARGFQATWSIVIGRPIPAGVNPCLSAFGAATITSATACLTALEKDESALTFAAPPYSDEDGFRQLIVRDNDAITTMTSLGGLLAQQTPVLTNQLSAFDGDLASLRADMNVMAGNVQAMEDAIDLLDSITPAMTKAQIKAKIIQTLNGGSKPVLDDGEVNLLTEQYYRLTQSSASAHSIITARSALELIWLEGRRQTEQELEFAAAMDPALALPQPANRMCRRDAIGVSTSDRSGIELGCLAGEIGSRYSFLLDRDHLRLSDELPTLIAQANVGQSSVLARTNEIYDQSQVAVPLDVAIVLGQPGNLRAYFTIYETETFPRFSIPASSSPTNPVVAAAPATIAAPPATSTTTTTTAAATTTTTTTAAQPSGNPITSGVLEVHDRYRATMVAAFAFSRVKETSILTNTVSTGMATGSTTACSTTAPCTQVTVSPGPAHSSVILGMSFHPCGYDTFPGAYSWKKPGEALKQGFGIFGGLSVQNLNDYYIGGDFQIAHGVQIMGGGNLYRQNTLAAGFTSGGIYPGTPTFTGPQQWTHGAYFGIGLNLSIFRKAFGSVTGLGTTAATGGS